MRKKNDDELLSFFRRQKIFNDNVGMCQSFPLSRNFLLLGQAAFL